MNRGYLFVYISGLTLSFCHSELLPCCFLCSLAGLTHFHTLLKKNTFVHRSVLVLYQVTQYLHFESSCLRQDRYFCGSTKSYKLKEFIFCLSRILQLSWLYVVCYRYTQVLVVKGSGYTRLSYVWYQQNVLSISEVMKVSCVGISNKQVYVKVSCFTTTAFKNSTNLN